MDIKDNIRWKDNAKKLPLKAYEPSYKQRGGYNSDYRSIETSINAMAVGIPKHKDIQNMSVQDIASLISKLLGLEFKCLEGKLIDGIVMEDK